jgi:hypothetical protein
MSEQAPTKDQVIDRRCGTCRYSYHNDTAVLSRLGCWKNHVPFLLFSLQHELPCRGVSWEKRR